MAETPADIAISADTIVLRFGAWLMQYLRQKRMAGLRLYPLTLVKDVTRRQTPDSIKPRRRRDATRRTLPMTTLFISSAGALLTLLVLSGHVLAQRMRGDLAVVASRRRMPSGGASDVA